MNTLFWDTVTPPLRSTLELLMNTPLFDPFRLVGGTSLSLQIGHRLSVDIDLFADATYGSLNFQEMDTFLRRHYPYVSSPPTGPTSMGHSYILGDSPQQAIKLDLFYTDNFIRAARLENNLRLATVEEIIAMKLDVIQRVGRKKDFWDLHALLNQYSIGEMLQLHEERYPYAHNPELILHNFTYFDQADGDFDPICLLGKYWELVKYEIAETVNAWNNNAIP